MVLSKNNSPWLMGGYVPLTAIAHDRKCAMFEINNSKLKMDGEKNAGLQKCKNV